MDVVSMKAFLAAALLLLGCSVEFNPGQQLFRCESGACPSNFECVNNVCLPLLPDAGGGDGGPDVCQAMGHLALSEVAFRTRSVSFIEIANPTSDAVLLDDYYLSDDDDYFKVPGLSGEGPAPSVTVSDFIRRFPAGVTLEAGAALVIAFDPESFTSTYQVAPDLSIDEFEFIAPLAGTPTLNKAGESLVLFRWDGTSDLVEDVDAIVWGEPDEGTGDGFGVKTDQMVDGPDADTTPSSYLADADTITTSRIAPGDPPGDSLHRILGEGGTELSDGNGITGDDETSEDLRVTWESKEPAPGSRSFCDPDA